MLLLLYIIGEMELEISRNLYQLNDLPIIKLIIHKSLKEIASFLNLSYINLLKSSQYRIMI